MGCADGLASVCIKLNDVDALPKGAKAQPMTPTRGYQWTWVNGIESVAMLRTEDLASIHERSSRVCTLGHSNAGDLTSKAASRIVQAPLVGSRTVQKVRRPEVVCCRSGHLLTQPLRQCIE